MYLQNTNPCGDAWVGQLNRDVKAGEVVKVTKDVAGRPPSDFVPVGVPTQLHLARVAEDGTWEQYDPGVGLLAQVGNWQVVDGPAVDEPAPEPELTLDQPEVDGG